MQVSKTSTFRNKTRLSVTHDDVNSWVSHFPTYVKKRT